MLKTYDPTQISLIVGPHIVTGYADGTFVKVSRNDDTFKAYVGADGEVTRTRSRNRTGVIEITLGQGSPSNDYLSALALQDELLGNGIVPALVKDMNGTTLEAAAEAWVRKPADTEYGKETGARTWTIECAQLEKFVGGHLDAVSVGGVVANVAGSQLL